MNLGIPVHIYEEGMQLPENGTYYVVSGNGIWLHKDMPYFRSFSKVDAISVLPDLNIKEFVVNKLPPLPDKHVSMIKKFFELVVETYYSEACVILYYNKELNDWIVDVPKQKASHSGVSYIRSNLTHLSTMGGYIPVGTIHSHCDFNAFHSSVDQEDEESFDGLHITFGNNNRNIFTISASIVINGQRYWVDPLQSLSGIAAFNAERGEYVLLEKSEDSVESWLEQVVRM